MSYTSGGGGGGVSSAPFSPPSSSGDVFFRDCAVRTCSIYCPQWCTYIFPPPPPDDSSGRFPPLFIALIGVLAGAFLLVCYYAVVSRYCRGRLRRRRRRVREGESVPDPDGSDPDRGHPWLAPETATAGLDEAVVKSIAVHKYRRGDGSVEGTDCSVCLGEFGEDDSLRLLPKCNHAFHVPCIDAWFKSHSNCPLCRSDLAAADVCHPAEPAPAAAVHPQTLPVSPGPRNSLLQIQRGGDATPSAAEDIERGGGRTDDDETIVVVITNGNGNENTDAAAPRKRSGEGENETRPKDRVGALLTRSSSVNNSQSTTEVVIFSREDRRIQGSSLMGAGSSGQHGEDEKAKGRNMGSVSVEYHSKGEKSGASNIPNREIGIVVQK